VAAGFEFLNEDGGHSHVRSDLFVFNSVIRSPSKEGTDWPLYSVFTYSHAVLLMATSPALAAIVAAYTCDNASPQNTISQRLKTPPTW